jgi:hypothetical protein
MQRSYVLRSTAERFAACIFLLLCITVPGLCTQAIPTMLVRPAVTTPVIDGQLNDPAWNGSSGCENFYLYSGEKPAVEQTRAYITYDNANLYIAFICYDSHMADLKTASSIFAGDEVEVFVDPGRTCDYSHIAVDSTGKTYFAWQMGNRENNVVAATKIFADRWQVEMAVPWKNIKWPASGGVISEWGINFCRSNPRTKEYSCWSPTVTGFHNPSRFGMVTGMKVDSKQFYLAQHPSVEVTSGVLAVSTDKTFYSVDKELSADIRVRFDGSLKGKEILLSVKDGEGRKLANAPIESIFLTNRKKVNISTLPPGDYTITASLMEDNTVIGEASQWFRKIKPMAQPANKVDIRNGVLYLNGKPHLPIILYFGSGVWSRTGEISIKDIEDAANKGFNTLLPGWEFLKDDLLGEREKIWKPANDGSINRIKNCSMTLMDVLNASQKNNLQVIPYFGYMWRTEKLDDESRIKMGADIIEKYRNHPAILCWHSNDETDGWIALNQKTYKLFKELDPYRPVFLNIIFAVAANKDGADILSTDPYPIGKTSILAVASHTDTLRRVTGGNPTQTCWLVHQLFCSPREGWPRCPTPKEERCMTFLSLNHGAKGLAYFGYSVEGARKKGERLTEELWQSMAELNRQVKAMSLPYLTGKEVEGFTSSSKDLDIAAKEYDGHTYVIVCNTLEKEVNAEISHAGIKLPKKIEVLFEGRSVDAKGTSIVDSFTGYDVHIYKL